MSIEDYVTGYELEYFKKYKEFIPRIWGGVQEEDREKVYKQALEEGKTWQQVTGYDKMPKGLIL